MKLVTEINEIQQNIFVLFLNNRHYKYVKPLTEISLTDAAEGLLQKFLIHACGINTVLKNTDFQLLNMSFGLHLIRAPNYSVGTAIFLSMHMDISGIYVLCLNN